MRTAGPRRFGFRSERREASCALPLPRSCAVRATPRLTSASAGVGKAGPALTTGFGLAYEYKRFSPDRLQFPVFGPTAEGDSVTKGVEIWPYAGLQIGVKVF